MRRAPKFICASLLLYNLLTMRLQAQSIDTDSLVTAAAYTSAVQQYHSFIAPEPGLYRGRQYVVYAYRIRDGHPYFDEGRVVKGAVLYDGILYNDVPLLYDLVKGLLITNDPFKFYKVALFNGQIDSFTLEDHIFIRQKDSLSPSLPRVGFYEQLYKGRIMLLKKEKKTIQQNMDLSQYIEHTTSYYIKKGETWYPVNNKRSLLYALKDRSREVKKFLRKNGLKMRKEKENTLIKVSAWYAGL
jgi:hypothetical protein